MGGRSGAGHLIVGEVRRAHGIKGECFVAPATDDVASVYAEGRIFRIGDGEGRAAEPALSLTLQVARVFKGGLIVRFAELRDRNAADAIRGRTLLIPAEDVRPLDEGEFFLHDLIGLEVVTADGARVGEVREVYEAGAGHFLGVDDGERERLIPLDGSIVQDVDIEAGRIVIAPTPGLLEI